MNNRVVGLAVLLCATVLPSASALGAGWTYKVVPDKVASGGTTCLSASWCMTAWRDFALWDGSRWTARGVSCPAPAFCMAAGGFYNAGYAGVLSKVAIWDGATWTVPVTGLERTRGGPALRAVSCTSPVYCVAVGDPQVSAVWDGARWTRQNTPGSLEAVACSAPNSCEGVGTSDRVTPLAAHFDGTRWTLQRMPKAGRTDFVNVSSVSCAAATACVATGAYIGRKVTRFLLSEGALRTGQAPS